MTTYRREELARRAIESVLSQDYEPLELIVVEDGSDSGLGTWVEERDTALERVAYVRHENNRGLAAARNTGIREARGEFIGFLDDDDVWLPSKTSRQVNLYRDLSPEERERVGVVYCAVERVTDDGGRKVSRPENLGSLREVVTTEGPATLPSTCLFPARVLEEVGGYDESLETGIDHDIWFSLAAGGYEARAVMEPLVQVYPLAPHQRMTGRTVERAEGVARFIRKWRPRLVEWMGEGAARTFVERYYADVLVRLAYRKAREGKLREAATALRAIFRRVDPPWRAGALMLRVGLGRVVGKLFR